jgi:hypothetical protein
MASLLSSTVYYWKVAVVDAHGNAAQGPVWSFETARRILLHHRSIRCRRMPTRARRALTLSGRAKRPGTSCSRHEPGTTDARGQCPDESVAVDGLSPDALLLARRRLQLRGDYSIGPVWSFVTTAVNQPLPPPAQPVPPDHAVDQMFNLTLKWQTEDPTTIRLHTMFISARADPRWWRSDLAARQYLSVRASPSRTITGGWWCVTTSAT